MILYTCGAQDDIFRIAKSYGIPPSKVLEDNGKGQNASLCEGETLVLFPGADYHTVRGGEELDGLCQRFHLRRERLLRQNPALEPNASLCAGTVLNVSAERRPPIALFVRFAGGDRRLLSRALPYASGIFLSGGRITEKYVELPRRKFLKSERRVFAEVEVCSLPTEERCRYLWAEVRKHDFCGLLFKGKQATCWTRALAPYRREGEWLFSRGECEAADFEIGASAPSPRTVSVLPLGGTVVEDGESRFVSEEEKDRMLAKWKSPILTENGLSYAQKAYRVGERQWVRTLYFSDLSKIKTELEACYKLGQRGFFVENLNDLTPKIRCLLGGMFG